MFSETLTQTIIQVSHDFSIKVEFVVKKTDILHSHDFNLHFMKKEHIIKSSGLTDKANIEG
jgi:hypothetical protein